MSDIRSTYTDSLNFFAGHKPVDLLKSYGSPLYVYNEGMLRRRAAELRDLVKLPNFRACYSAKANANPHLLRIIRSEGLLVDSMSPGELAMNRLAGFSRDQIIYVCNNVHGDELAQAAISSRVVSVDSLSQLALFGRTLQERGIGQEYRRVMLRLNPGIGAGHHQKVVTAGKETKFGINPEDFGQAREICRQYGLALVGVNQHVGSLFMQADAFLQAAEWLLQTVETLQASNFFDGLEIIDFGGGFGIPYHKYEGQTRLDLDELGTKLTARLKEWISKTGYQGLFLIEPGRYLAAECGLLLGSVTAIKNNGPTRFACTDVGFNILPRPMLYDAFHDVEIYRGALNPEHAESSENNDCSQRPELPQTLTGNICESGDLLASGRLLPEIREHDLLGFLDAGAYCYAMSFPYNQRVRPAEILIGLNNQGEAGKCDTPQGQVKLIRRRENLEDLLAQIPPLDDARE
ncbi:MAG: diaminopimelate decarboxylase [Deltaproteobacteria bacterium]|jgi:diaminopimelate decarboxylase|nr:diaminopimelate decarboxylase [Deltaproteobacteria bacterium]